MTTLDAILLLATSLSPGTATRYARSVDAEAARYKINPKLIVAEIYNESRFYRWAIKGRNHGLMQLRVSATVHSEYLDRESELYHPELNIRLGTKLLNYWRGYHERHCGEQPGHHWWSHFQWGKRVGDRGSGDRVAATMLRLEAP